MLHQKNGNTQLSVRGYHQPIETSTLFYKHKDSCTNSLEVSLTNWKTKVGKQGEQTKQPHEQNGATAQQSNVKLQKEDDKAERPADGVDYRGMTLQQYFRVKSSQQCKTEENTRHEDMADDPEPDDAALFGSLMINETDEDRYNESAQSVHTPDFNMLPQQPVKNSQKQQKIIDKYSRLPTKLKTQAEEEPDIKNMTMVRPKRHRLPSVVDSQSRTIRMQEHHKRKRTTSNPHHEPKQMRFTFNDFYKNNDQERKERAMQKVRNQKNRAAQIRINELFLVTKYAQRFNIQDSICRQIIRDGYK